MKTHSNERFPILTPLFMAILCLVCVGCKDTLRLKGQRREIVAQTEALNAQFADLETKLSTLRKTLPTASTPKAATDAITKAAQKDLDTLAAEKAVVTKQIQAQEERVALLQKEIAEFKAGGQTPTPASSPKS
jgi:septal ring factor EnvC (AmiA/AmiB activator)